MHPCISDLLQDISAFESTYLGQRDSPVKKKALLQIQRALLKTRELGDEKLQVVSHIIENVENRSRQLEQDLENLGKCWQAGMRVYTRKMYCSSMGGCEASTLTIAVVDRTEKKKKSHPNGFRNDPDIKCISTSEVDWMAKLLKFLLVVIRVLDLLTLHPTCEIVNKL